MAVVVVTDSSARLDPDELKRWDIRVVPLHVLQDGIDYLDGVDPIPQDVQDRSHVSTSGAAPGDLADVYQQALADSGGDGVVAVHLSAGLSSTFSSAAAVGRELGSAVRVVNSRSAAMGVGFVAVAAARAAAAGADLDAVEAQARSESTRQHGFIVVHRLDNLRRSGRIGTAASWLGTALSLKPLLQLDIDGRLVLDQRIRVDNHDDAAQIGAALTSRLPQVDSLVITDMGPVLAVHVGSGAVGVIVST
ncbi:DegV family protein [Mycolicibacterium sp. CBMA 361]|uniref:DegV family protein n=1 Tax=Mycolicibacterium sp. CBMA 361 TaxID=2606610 RepID=UPI0012DD9334|nr:DegV family protein [Mycolicibacterium sp. CBMA 361]MUM34398.1 DegV family protein [Mycolicibacterium sp. CBMA 361]